MFVIRPIAASDHEAFVKLAFEAGLGITSLPKNPPALHNMIEHSERSFAKTLNKPGEELYLFVLENLQDNTLAGVCGIHAKTGISKPIIFYRIAQTSLYNPIQKQPIEVPALKLVHYQDAPTEICSLFLSRAARHSGLGRLLSLSRFLFIASFLDRFDKMVFADMRGVVEHNHDCLFWEGIAQHFVNMDYASFLEVKHAQDISIHEALPQTPIYIPLLPYAVQNTIGKVHENTKPALNMLMQEGFTISDDISIYDGGPKIEAETREIHTVKASQVATVKSITAPTEDSVAFLIANTSIHYRCCYGTLLLDEEQKASLTPQTAAALHVNPGDQIRFISHERLHP